MRAMPPRGRVLDRENFLATFGMKEIPNGTQNVTSHQPISIRHKIRHTYDTTPQKIECFAVSAPQARLTQRHTQWGLQGLCARVLQPIPFRTNDLTSLRPSKAPR